METNRVPWNQVSNSLYSMVMHCIVFSEGDPHKFGEHFSESLSQYGYSLNDIIELSNKQ